MRISDALTKRLLERAGTLTDEQWHQLRAHEKQEKRPLQDLVVRDHIISEKALTQLYAEDSGVPFVELSPADIKQAVLRRLPERIAHQYGAVVFAINQDGSVNIALSDPTDQQTIQFLQKQLGVPLRIHSATDTHIQAALTHYRNRVRDGARRITVHHSPQHDHANATRETTETEPETEASSMAEAVRLILERAIKTGATDIHIEPREALVAVRYRVDGMLHEAHKVPRSALPALARHMKQLASLNLEAPHTPQAGACTLRIGELAYGLRITTMPVVYGEKIVVHIMNDRMNNMNSVHERDDVPTLEALGYWGTSLERISRAIVQPHGLLLVTGPAGSGKATSLWSMLHIINTPTRTVYTVEDPIKHTIAGASQTQVASSAGSSLEGSVRAVLRQDPDIVMISELRDTATARLAVQAAVTGHLVFSALYTETAAAGLTRLRDMGIEPFLVATTVRALVGQRLVRTLCLQCRERITPTEPLLATVSKTFHITSATVMKRLHELEVQARAAGLGITPHASGDGVAATELSTTPKTITTLWRAHPDGCAQCGYTGYRGRVGVYEVLEITDAIQALLVSNRGAAVIHAAAIEQGMMTMQMDGLVKALRGQTTIEELQRVLTPR